jgi:hypothetical protein
MPLAGWDRVGRDNEDYKTCVQAASAAGAVLGMVTGAAAGGVGAPAGFVAGALWGFAAGYLACPYLAPAVRKKIEGGQTLSDVEVRSAADALGRYASVHQAPDAIRLLGLVRQAQCSPMGRAGAPAGCVAPAASAQQLLRRA